jgi:hypothetical protein
MFMVLALLADTSLAEAEQRLSRMTVLYEQVCLTAFPDDKAVEALMAAQNARPLTQEEVKITMRDDPARGWELKDGSASVWLEFPPFHACSVRWNAAEIGDLDEYRAVVEKYKHAKGSFQPIGPFDDDQGGIHIHAVGEQRVLPHQTSESLFIFDQHITDPKRRAAGETGVSLRFVHQFARPPDGPAKSPSPSLIGVERAQDHAPLIMLGFMAVGDEPSLKALESAADLGGLKHGRTKNNRNETQLTVLFPPGSSRASSLNLYRAARAGKFGPLRLEVTIVPVSAAVDGIDLEKVSIEPPGYIAEPRD